MLKLYCDQKRIVNGVYECIERFRYRVTVQEQTFDGAPFSTKHEAKKDAAQRAIEKLKLEYCTTDY